MIEVIQHEIKTKKREEIIDITEEIQEIIRKLKVSNGICRIFIPHTTAGITINENADPNVKVDFLYILKKLIPQSREYKHTEGNSDAHVKASMMGFSQTLLFQDSRLVLGTWQGLWFCEFDGPRTRNMMVSLEGTK